MEVEVVRGLEEGQLIVTGPFKVLRELKNGDRVRREGEQERKGNRKGS
jgi:hypothetical protein